MKTRLIPLLFAFVFAVAFAATEAESVARYLKYRSLVRITEERIDVPKATSMMCRDPRDAYGVHYKPGIHLYANALAIEAREGGGEVIRYPIGSLLVKEKFDTTEDTNPSIITVMEKTANEGRVEDWNFTMIRLADRSVVTEGFKVSCVDCHNHYRRTDFVSSETSRLLEAYVKK